VVSIVIAIAEGEMETWVARGPNYRARLGDGR
jgi:hypothetical protein